MEVTIPWNAYMIAQSSLLSHPPNLSNSPFSIPAFLIRVRRLTLPRLCAPHPTPLYEATRSGIRKTGSEVTGIGERKTESQKIRPSHFHPRKRPSSQRWASPGSSPFPPGSIPPLGSYNPPLTTYHTPFPDPNTRNPGFWNPSSGPVGLLEPSRPTSLPSLRSVLPSPRTTRTASPGLPPPSLHLGVPPL